MKANFKTRCAAILLIAAGYGWAGGHYIPSNSGILSYSFQFIILGILLLLSIKFFSLSEPDRQKRNWPVNGLSILSVLALLMNILNILNGAFNKDADSFGSHNTFADLVPIAIIIAGAGLWVLTILPFKERGRYATDDK